MARLSKDARVAISGWSAAELRAAADEAARREAATPAFAALGFQVADLLGVEPEPRGDKQGVRWAAAVLTRVSEVIAEGDRLATPRRYEASEFSAESGQPTV